MADRAPLTLKQRIFAAGGWTVAGFGLSQALRFGTSLLMTRLLVPEMFGVMAIANMIMIGLAMFSDIGLRQNVVQSKRGAEVRLYVEDGAAVRHDAQVADPIIPRDRNRRRAKNEGIVQRRQIGVRRGRQ